MITKNRADRILERIEELCKFCPVCGTELVITKNSVVIHGLTLNTTESKDCPQGHGSLFGSFDAEPYATFDVNKELWKDVV